MSSYLYTNGDGLTVLDVLTPVGATDPVSDLDNAVQQIKLFLKDGVAGVARLLGPTGQLTVLVKGTSLPTGVTGDSYLFLKTDTAVLYYVVDTIVTPIGPVGGAVAGKFLKSAGLLTAATWSNSVISKIFVEGSTTPANGAQTNVKMTLAIISGSHAAISITSGGITVADGYTIVIRAQASGVESGIATHRLQNVTGSTTVQTGFAANLTANDFTKLSFFDCTYINSSGSSATIELQITTSAGCNGVAGLNSRLVLEVHPN